MAVRGLIKVGLYQIWLVSHVYDREEYYQTEVKATRGQLNQPCEAHTSVKKTDEATNTQLLPSRLQKSQIPTFLHRSEIPTIFEDFCMGCSIVVKKFQNHIYISEKKIRKEK